MTRILIVGLGGVGGYYGGLLARKYTDSEEVEIYFLARGAHLEKVKENGLTIIAEDETFVVHPKLATDNATEIGIVDFALITPKSYDLTTTIEQIKPCIGSETVILPLLNGVDISDRIRKMLPNTEVWDGCVYIVGRLKEPGVVQSSGGVHDLFFGNDKSESIKLQQLEKILLDAGIKANYSRNIRMIIWRKYIFISTSATLTSYFNVGFRDLLTDNNRKETTLKHINEVVQLAQAEGVVFENDIIETTIKHIERLPFGTTSSMHSDFINGRRTELETLTGIVIELGKKLGIETPEYEKVYNALL
ncbi:MAG: ketopantoate reductase family protein [Paludibacter sp.]